MTIGELEYDNVLTDNVGKKDATTGLQKVPMEGITYVLYSIFLLLMPIILMNLLVSRFLCLHYCWCSFIIKLSNISLFAGVKSKGESIIC